MADGAQWIWKRVAALFESLGIPAERCFELVDFYHAVEYLGKIAESKKAWKPAERKRWIRTQRRRLFRGELGTVLDAITAAIGSRPTKDQRRWRTYFQRNGLDARRMDYSATSAQQLPIGSGAMESAIRRILNLRLKGASIFWHERSAEAVILLRAYYKTGRSQDLHQNALTGTYALAL